MGQGHPFNAALPYACTENPSGRPLTGCTVTAVAQLLAYYRAQPLTHPGKYDWGRFLTSYRNTYTEEEAQVISALIYDITEGIGARYGCYGSECYFPEATGYLQDVFGFTCSQVLYDMADAISILPIELQKGHMVWMGASNRKGNRPGQQQAAVAVGLYMGME
ncbi:MAG: C10 family peptidase [Tannerellaceae bacterium]|nr:C10 family peptidase [Tannerellaceae bacterium]